MWSWSSPKGHIADNTSLKVLLHWDILNKQRSAIYRRGVKKVPLMAAWQSSVSLDRYSLMILWIDMTRDDVAKRCYFYKIVTLKLKVMQFVASDKGGHFFIAKIKKTVIVTTLWYLKVTQTKNSNYKLSDFPWECLQQGARLQKLEELEKLT